MHISETKKKNRKKFRPLERSAFELIAVNCPGSKKNACNRQSMC